MNHRAHLAVRGFQFRGRHDFARALHQAVQSAHGQDAQRGLELLRQHGDDVLRAQAQVLLAPVAFESVLQHRDVLQVALVGAQRVRKHRDQRHVRPLLDRRPQPVQIVLQDRVLHAVQAVPDSLHRFLAQQFALRGRLWRVHQDQRAVLARVRRDGLDERALAGPGSAQNQDVQLIRPQQTFRFRGQRALRPLRMFCSFARYQKRHEAVPLLVSH